MTNAFPPQLYQHAATLLTALEHSGLKVAVAESCTGGLLAALLTAVPGSSRTFDRGFVTYSNDAKSDMLGVPMPLIETHGAVSAPVAQAMAEGARRSSRADITVAITGIAGPDGGAPQKPVGLVHFACARDGQPTRQEEHRFGPIGRDAVRMAAVDVALRLLQRSITPD